MIKIKSFKKYQQGSKFTIAYCRQEINFSEKIWTPVLRRFYYNKNQFLDSRKRSNLLTRNLSKRRRTNYILLGRREQAWVCQGSKSANFYSERWSGSLEIFWSGAVEREFLQKNFFGVFQEFFAKNCS